MITVLLWSEWRRQRNVIYSLLALIIFSWLAANVLLGLRIQELLVSEIIGAMMIGLPVLFCFALTDSFTCEYDKNTSPFLQGLPITPGQIFLSKYLYSLAIYFSLSIFAVILLKGQICTETVFALKGASKDEILLLRCLAVISFFLLHAAVFFFAMIGRRSGTAIITIVILPLVLLSFLPWLALLMVFLTRINGSGFILLLVLDSLVFAAAFPCFGYYLWTRRISRGLSVKKTLLCAALITIFLPLLVFAGTYGWTAIELDLAFRAAEKAGLALRFRQLQSSNSATTADVTPELQKFAEAFYRNMDEKAPYYKFFAEKPRKGHQYWPSRLSPANLGIELTGEERSTGAASLLLDPRMIELNVMLETIVTRSNPFLRNSAATEEEYQAHWQNIRKLEPAICFLLARGTACRIANRPAEMYKCWTTALQLMKIIENERLGWTGLFRARLSVAIAQAIIADAGKEPEYKSVAMAMIRQLEQIDITAGTEDFCYFPEWWEKDKTKIIDGSLFNPKMLFVPPQRELPPWHNALRISALPRAQHLLAAHMDFATKTNILSRRITTFPPFETIRKDHDSLYEKYYRLTGLWEHKKMGTLIIQFYVQHNSVSMNRIALALLIHRNEQGMFPSTLQELSPAILPVIPTAAFTGKPFDYRRDGNGFTISADDVPGTPWKILPPQLTCPLTFEEDKK